MADPLSSALERTAAFANASDDGRPPVFDAGFRTTFEALLKWRRDVRRFRSDPVGEPLIAHLLDMAQYGPSVGNSQPWRWVRVDSEGRRDEIRRNFKRCNAAALASLHGERAETYAKLKLEGLGAAPIQFAVFCDRGTEQGHGLGCRTMPETLDYSVVAMLTTVWLCARSFGLGMGWVSIVEPRDLIRILDVPESWRLVAYLCIGWPIEEHVDPELERNGWQRRLPVSRQTIVR